MRRRSLPQVVIPVPCHVDWNAMTRIDSEGRARFCAAVAFWSMVFAAWSWAWRPAQSIIEGAGSAEAETRKLPFIIKPPDDSESDWENALGRPTISHKPRAYPRRGF